MNILFLVIFFFLLSFNDVSAQKWTNYNSQNTISADGKSQGLLSDVVFSMAIDKKGNKWFATLNGLTKFDGTSWVTYTQDSGLAYHDCRKVQIDAQGNKWIATYGGGVSKFDGKKWTTYDTLNGLISNYAFSVNIDKEGNKWFGTDKGVAKFNDTTWTYFDTINYVDNICFDSNDNKWFATSTEVYELEKNTWTTYNFNNGLPAPASGGIAVDAQNNVWIGTNAGVSRYDGTTFTNYTTPDAFPQKLVNAIAFEKTGKKWFGTLGDEAVGGAFSFDGANWATYTTADGLADNNIFAIAIDSNNNKWFATGKGISLFEDEPLAVSQPQGSSNVVLFPNPCEQAATIYSDEVIRSILISDLQGVLISQLTFPFPQKNTEISLTGITSGAYLLQINTDSGSLQKLLIKK